MNSANTLESALEAFLDVNIKSPDPRSRARQPNLPVGLRVCHIAFFELLKILTQRVNGSIESGCNMLCQRFSTSMEFCPGMTI